MNHRVHIFGASGSGTTTLGASLAQSLWCPHFDSDNYLWLPTDPPFQQLRKREQRQHLMIADLSSEHGWVLSGSLCGWGDVAIPLFDLAVFLWIPQELRMSRLLHREQQRYGE
jgi:adenylate kinase family enzyme